MRAALVDLADPGEPHVERILERPVRPGVGALHPRDGPDGMAGPLETIAGLVVELSAGGVEHPVGAGVRVEPVGGRRRPIPVGIGIAGFVDNSGRAIASPNVPEVVGLDVVGEVSRLCGSPVVVDNDANCVARAELAARGAAVDNLVAVTLGTGIGAGVVVRGRVLRGAHGFAGEPGHMVVDPNGPECPCGQRGCWERYASGSGLEMLARRSLGPDPLRGEEVVSAALRGDSGAIAVIEEFGFWLALGIANLVNLLDPAVVVLGGGLADAAPAYLPATRRALEAYPTVRDRGVVVEPARSGATAGVIGAALSSLDSAATWAPRG